MELDEKGEGMKKYKLIVTKQSQGCRVQHREYSQYYCKDYVQRQMGARVTEGITS